MKSFLSKVLHLIAALAIAFSAFANWNPAKAKSADAAVPSLQVTLSADADSFGSDQSVIVHVTLTNTSNDVVRVLKWYTPTVSDAEPLLNVTLDGAPVSYSGAVYKRVAPTEADYLTLGSGESVSGDLNLSALYDLSGSGNYSIAYQVSADNLYLTAGTRGWISTSGSLVSDVLNLVIDGRKPQPEIQSFMDLETIQTLNGSTSFNSCSPTRQTALTTGRQNAYDYAVDTVQYFTNLQQGARYTTWFGTYNATRYNTVKDHFTKIKNAFNNDSIIFDCTCTDSFYAYVYPSDTSNTIYLCNAFWSAPATGTDSKAGTLIHEMSHFNDIAGTDDNAYGQSAAKTLAKNNPAGAVDNADNHEYFAENTPSLETTGGGGGGATFTISGNAGVSGATLSYVNGSAQTATADGNGNYSFTIPSGWSGTLTPSKSGYTFSPVNKSFSNVTANKTQNFTATATGGGGGGGSNLLLDPGFEANTPSAIWTESSTNYGTPLCTASSCGTETGAAPRSGSVWAWFGGIEDDYEEGHLSQSVVFPSGGTATLTFYLWVGRADSGSDASDVFFVTVDGTQVFSANATQTGAYPNYTLVTLNLDAYADGNSHTIDFGSVITTQYVSFDLDDVSLTGSGGGGGSTQTNTFTSNAANDGYITESNETSSQGGSISASATDLRAGDNSSDKQFRSILSFDTSGLPDSATISSVTLQLKYKSLSGTNPFSTHGNLLVDIKKLYFGLQGLEKTDFQASASKSGAGIFGTTAVGGWYTVTLDSSAFSFVNKTGVTQFRVRFSKDDNDDFGNDFLAFFSGNTSVSGDRPLLTIQFSP